LFDLTLTNRLPDMIEEGYDMSIVLARELPDSGLSLSGLARPTAFSARRRPT
jgi:hypothetical protein